MFILGDKLLRELYNEPGGVWVIRADNENIASLLAKLPAYAIKAVYKGAATYLLVSVVEIRGVRVRIIGLRIDDDSTHPLYVSSPSRGAEELILLKEIITRSNTFLHFFDERVRSVMSITCLLDEAQKDEILASLSSTNPHYGGNSFYITGLAQDIFSADREAAKKGLPTQALMRHAIKLQITHSNVVNIVEVDRGGFQLDAQDEGGGLEQSAHGSLQIVFDDNTFRSPLVRDSGTERELTDLLGLSTECICIVESKALSILSTDISRPSERRTRSITKDIDKGLGQIIGATKRIRSSSKIFTNKDDVININNPESNIIHGIILLSEMNPFVDWQSVADKFIEASNESNRIYYQVLDLQELQQLAQVSRFPHIFSTNLFTRWQRMRDERDALVRGEVPPQKKRR